MADPTPPNQTSTNPASTNPASTNPASTNPTSTKKTMEGFLELVAKMNPYTSGSVDDMDLYIGHPTEGKSAPDPSQIEMELDGDYPGEWSFKGQPQKINRVLRIKYRCKARDKARSKDDFYWMTAYLLIGFEDGGP